MKAMVLAAGQGTRLRPLTDCNPKALIPVAGRAMIEYPLRLLRHYGIREIVINLHHHGDQIEKYLGSGEKHDVQIIYSNEPELLDTGGGLLKARPFLEEGTFIVINTDVLIDLPLDDLVAFHREKQAVATLVLRPDKLADQYGSMEINEERRVYRFLDAEIPTKSRAGGRKFMFTGVQILEPRVFNCMPFVHSGTKFSTTKHVYPHLLRRGEAIYGYVFEGYWQDLGTAARIKEAEADLIQGRPRLHFL
jgi:NDP-sugar pyrophosphorylase family protein